MLVLPGGSARRLRALTMMLTRSSSRRRTPNMLLSRSVGTSVSRSGWTPCTSTTDSRMDYSQIPDQLKSLLQEKDDRIKALEAQVEVLIRAIGEMGGDKPTISYEPPVWPGTICKHVPWPPDGTTITCGSAGAGGTRGTHVTTSTDDPAGEYQTRSSDGVPS